LAVYRQNCIQIRRGDHLAFVHVVRVSGERPVHSPQDRMDDAARKRELLRDRVGLVVESELCVGIAWVLL
jgi:hypothetical protein